MRKLARSQKGFTILELMIATTVFSTILLLATTGMIQIGRVYYKGIVTSKTQETTRTVVDEISRTVQLNGSEVTANQSVDGPNGEKAFCVGSIRYTYKIGEPVSDTGSGFKHAVWKDKLINSTCNVDGMNLKHDVPSDVNVDTNAPRGEVLAANMRLANFLVEETTGNSSLVKIKMKVIYGATDLVDSTTGTCLPTRQGGQFCAIAELNTFVKKRL